MQRAGENGKRRQALRGSLLRSPEMGLPCPRSSSRSAPCGARQLHGHESWLHPRRSSQPCPTTGRGSLGPAAPPGRAAEELGVSARRGRAGASPAPNAAAELPRHNDARSHLQTAWAVRAVGRHRAASPGVRDCCRAPCRPFSQSWCRDLGTSLLEAPCRRQAHDRRRLASVLCPSQGCRRLRRASHHLPLLD